MGFLLLLCEMYGGRGVRLIVSRWVLIFGILLVLFFGSWSSKCIIFWLFVLSVLVTRFRLLFSSDR